GRQVRGVRGDPPVDRAGFEPPKEARQLGPAHPVPSSPQEAIHVGDGAGRAQEDRDVEAFAIELEQVAGVAMEREPTPGLTTQADGGMSLEPSCGPAIAAHTRSSSPTIVLAARDSLGCRPRGFPLEGGWFGATRASWSRDFVHDFR